MRAAVCLFLGLFPFASARAQSRPAAQSVAHTLVTASAHIREGERVLISGSPRDMELLGDLAIEVMKVGGQPFVTVWTDTLTRRSYDEVPPQYDSAVPTLGIDLSGLFDAQIAVDIGEAEGLLAGVPPSRLSARNEAAFPANEAFRKRGTRFINLGNGLYPTATLARRLGITMVDLEASFWRGVASDPAAVKANGEKLRRAFARGTKVSFTHPNGTDLSFRITGRTPAVSDGSLEGGQSPAGVAPLTWLPAGEFQLTPVPGTAEGKLVIDRLLWGGDVISALALTISKGRIVGMAASANLDQLKARYDAAGPGKDEFASIDIGFNPDVSLPLDTGWIVWMAPGAVTFTMGDNTFIGGSNHSEFSFSAQQGGMTMRVDGRPVILRGRLQ
jgi:leucyl aminopeptidase (aminopeptidase T)